jgi:hypothetical protein
MGGSLENDFSRQRKRLQHLKGKFQEEAFDQPVKMT